MADNYIKLHEMFQAKATLQSIIDNASDTILVNMAQEKLQLVHQQLEADSLAQANQANPTQMEANEFKTLDEDQNK